MVVIKDGVVNEPVVPVPPPPDEVHAVLLVDDQLRVEVAPFAIEDGDAVRVTTGNGVEVEKVAVTVTPAFIVTSQLPIPEQPPDQPAKLEPVAGVAYRLTLAPLL
ncbi:MAG: hypothetical protein A2V79_06380 [Betaproteobacteria bacterium RBG_16_56_24]|nr:MAG: hypothetical protein A2V79_06380 [Betaproteobacteria bacterium RBG_16_56_24]